MTRSTPVRLAALALLLIGGCAAMPPRGEVAAIDLPAGIEGTTPMAVDVETSRGDVLVEVDPRAKAPRVVAMTTNARGERVRASWAAAMVEQAEPYPILRVLAMADDRAARADLTVIVPACVGLRVRNVGGDVTVRGVRGAVDVQSGSDVTPGGNVSVSLGEALDAPLMVRSSRGSVVVSLPKGSRGALHVTSGVGRGAIVAPRAELRGLTGAGGSWRAVLNDGEHDCRVIADQGSAEIRVAR